VHDYRVMRPLSDGVFCKLFTTRLMGNRIATSKLSESAVRLVRLR
jgi:hypothetical protein